MKEITFLAGDDYIAMTNHPPEPIKFSLPEWYKKMDPGKLVDVSAGDKRGRTVKSCVPFLDALTTGYALKLPVDYHLRITKQENQKFKVEMGPLFQNTGLAGIDDYLKKINADPSIEYHGSKQIEYKELQEKNYNVNFGKFLNPWVIKTPLGYSCLFVHPLNNHSLPFEIIAGIVDTDTFNLPVNFPFHLNKEKFPDGVDTVIKAGTPFVQVIPFKRDSWKMKIKKLNFKEYFREVGRYNLHWLHWYRKFKWFKKEFK